MNFIFPSVGCSRRSFLALGLMTFAMPACVAGKSGGAAYGAKVNYSKGIVVSFAHFDLKYIGNRKVSSPSYPRGMICHDFEISRGTTSKTVFWSSGTGDIGPTVFQFDGKEFWLELSRSDKLGKLAENEVVVWKK